MAVAVAVLFIGISFLGGLALADEKVFFTASNGAGGNEVIAIHMDRHGGMSVAATASTAGMGGTPDLGNQGGVLATHNGVIVVNAGSNTIASLRYHHGDLDLESVVSSGGVRPISLTSHNNEVCVLNEGSATVSANVSCFKLNDHGELKSIPGAMQSLGLGKGVAEVSFCNDGHALAITAKATNEILTMRVHNKMPGGVMSFDTTVGAGRVPFGFRCADDVLITTFATSTLPGGPGGAGSYMIAHDGSVVALTPFESDTRMAACWLALNRNETVAYAINTPTHDISSYHVEHDGEISLLDPIAATVGVAVTEAVTVGDGKFFVVLSPTTGEVFSYTIHHDGSLTAADILLLMPGINGLDGK